MQYDLYQYCLFLVCVKVLKYKHCASVRALVTREEGVAAIGGSYWWPNFKSVTARERSFRL